MEYSHDLEQKESQYQQADLRTKQLRNDSQRYNELKHEYDEKVTVVFVSIFDWVSHFNIDKCTIHFHLISFIFQSNQLSLLRERLKNTQHHR